MAIVYNPLGHDVSSWIRIPVVGDNYDVRDAQLNPVTVQVLCSLRNVFDFIYIYQLRLLVFIGLLAMVFFISFHTPTFKVCHRYFGQVVPLTVSTMDLPDHNGSRATADLIFKADLPPLGFTSYFVKPSSGG